MPVVWRPCRQIEEGAYLRVLNFCTLLRGPEAQRLATYVGWKMHGVRGGLVAGGLFVLPAAVVIPILSLLYAYAADLGPVARSWGQGSGLGHRRRGPAAGFQARAQHPPVKWAIAAAAFVGLFVFRLPFPLVIVATALVGTVLAYRSPRMLGLKTSAPGAPPADSLGQLMGRTLWTILVWAAIWAAPMLLILATLGPDHVLFQVRAFVSKLAMVTFGGAYAALAYMAQEAVQTHGSLRARAGPVAALDQPARTARIDPSRSSRDRGLGVSVGMSSRCERSR